MMGLNLALIVLLGQVPSSDPTVLVSQLGAKRYAEREAAAAALERLGRQSLPALRLARDAREPEIRARAGALVDRIEGALLTQPTLVTLDFQDRPLPEVIKSVSAATGIKIALVPENSPVWPTRRISLHESIPLPFWKAVDRLCEASHLQYNFGMHGVSQNREPVFPLFDGGVRPSGPMSDSGPFRINLVSLHHQRDVSFLPVPQMFFNHNNRGGLRAVPAPAQPLTRRPEQNVNELFYAQVQVAAEPRLALSQNGPLKLVEAVDDRGQSLLLAPADAQVQARNSGYFGLTTGSVVQLQANLAHPEQPGKLIKKFRGVLPIAVSTRKPNPLVISLAGAAGKSFHNDEVTLLIQDIKPNTNNQTSIELSVRASAGAPRPDVGGAEAAEFIVQRPDMHQQQIEIVDAQDRVIPWYHSSFDAEGARMTLTLNPTDQVGPPSEIRYYALARAVTEIGFEFTDVPMP